VPFADEHDDAVVHRREVRHVLGDHAGVVSASESGDLVVGRAGQADLEHVLCFVASSAEMLRRRGREHLVDEEPHVRSA
jgi:hypothetical protein